MRSFAGQMLKWHYKCLWFSYYNLAWRLNEVYSPVLLKVNEDTSNMRWHLPSIYKHREKKHIVINTSSISVVTNYLCLQITATGTFIQEERDLTSWALWKARFLSYRASPARTASIYQYASWSRRLNKHGTRGKSMTWRHLAYVRADLQWWSGDRS